VTTPVVLGTGAGGGMGRAIAQRFARDGWRIAATDFDDAKLDELEATVPLVARVPADLRSAEACHGVFAETMARAGRIDALVNAAGVWREGPVESFTEADFDLVLAVNLKAMFFMCAAVIPALRASKGAIVNISSDAGRQGNVGAAAYCASKGGVTNFTRALALDLAPDGVRANVVSPGCWTSRRNATAAATRTLTRPRCWRSTRRVHPPGGSRRPRVFPVPAGRRSHHGRGFRHRLRLFGGEVAGAPGGSAAPASTRAFRTGTRTNRARRTFCRALSRPQRSS